jgi:3',5'-cyclic AMP phosphodiesterase CpdA
MSSKLNLIFLTLVISDFCFAQKVVRGPYLQQLTKNGVVLRWDTDKPTNSKWGWSMDSKNFTFSKDQTLRTSHEAVISGLLPSTKYYYLVGSDNLDTVSYASFDKSNYFITAPAQEVKHPMNFWAMGDFGVASTEKYVQNQIDVRNQYLKNKAEHTDLWLWLGDNAYCCGTQEEYQKQVFDIYGKDILTNTAVYPSPGNHEYYATATAPKDRIIPYYDIITTPTRGEAGGVPSGTEAYYSFDYGNIHFVSLDTYGMDDGKFKIYDKQSPQLQWLERDLAANKSLWTIVFFHHPPYTKRSHDSDAEEDLRLIREALVPVFDKYKVDLVMSGHSHIYERSHLIKNHTGHSMSFSAKEHIVQNTNAFYTKTSKPIINKEEGTIYLVIGSAGRLDWNGRPDAHPSSVYSNYEIGGSVMLTVDENRLDGKWVCSDGVIRDKFTVFKNVNKTQKTTIEFGSKIKLSASWKGNYRWSNGIVNQQQIEVSPRKDSVITVTDSLGYLIDKFEIMVLPQPRIITQLLSNEVICTGKEVKLNFDLKNTILEKWNYTLELSDKNGTFNKPLTLAKGKTNSFIVTLPDTLSDGDKYLFRVKSDADFFDEVPTNPFRINRPIEARILNDSPIPFDTTLILKVQLTGSLPANLKITGLPEQKVENLLVEFKVKQMESATYEIEKLNNACGVGKINGSKITVLAPLSVEEQSQDFIIYPNPSKGIFYIESNIGKSIKTRLIIRDINGKRVFDKMTMLDTKDEISLDNFPSGIYVLELKNKNGKWSRKLIKE